jgi:hypothetical protein
MALAISSRWWAPSPSFALRLALHEIGPPHCAETGAGAALLTLASELSQLQPARAASTHVVACACGTTLGSWLFCSRVVGGRRECSCVQTVVLRGQRWFI